MKTTLKKLAIVLLTCSMLYATACNQSTIAALVNELGTASASLASLEGNTAVATQLKNDTLAAVTAINNWKPGSASTSAIEAMNIVIADLNLIPGTGPYAALIDLALGTAENIITIVESQSPAPATAAIKPRVQARVVTLPSPPKDKTDFKKQWNAIVAQNPDLGKAKL